MKPSPGSTKYNSNCNCKKPKHLNYTIQKTKLNPILVQRLEDTFSLFCFWPIEGRMLGDLCNAGHGSAGSVGFLQP